MLWSPGGDSNDTEGFINHVKQSQLSIAHKNNIYGHVVAGIANATGMEQHKAEQLVATGGAALGMVGLNSLVGNPVGKVTRSFKNGTRKLLGKDTLEDSNHSSNNKNTNNTLNDSVDNSKTSNMNQNISPSDEIKSSRENLTKYTEEFDKVSNNRKKLQSKFDSDDRKGDVRAEDRPARLKEIEDVRKQENKLSDKMQDEKRIIDSNKDFLKIPETKRTKEKVVSYSKQLGDLSKEIELKENKFNNSGNLSDSQRTNQRADIDQLKAKETKLTADLKFESDKLIRMAIKYRIL